MRIDYIRCRDLSGTLEFEGPFWEERLSRPIDLYDEHRREEPDQLPSLGPGRHRIRQVFVEIHTDSGICGVAGPIGGGIARTVLGLAGLLQGEDPLAVELLWDKLYRSAVHGRKGETMMAISTIDCALWDLRGKWAGAPVYRLLGGPTRARISAYASMLGFSVEPERVRERAREYAAMGYRAQKWFFRASPPDGPAGIERNVALAEAAREAMGPEGELMLDCWMSWTLRYAKQMAPRLAPYAPRWIEEPTLPDKFEVCAEIRRSVPFPVSNGEHGYTRWGFAQLLAAGAQDVLQPDLYWAGGITEMLKIAALASVYDVELVPHGHSTPATLQFLAAQPPNLCPIQEYLVKWNTLNQFFLKRKLTPVQGYFELPDEPGMGMGLDEDLIEEETLLD